MNEKQIIEAYHNRLIDAINQEIIAYRQRLFSDKTLTETAFRHMSNSIHGCKICINNAVKKVSSELNDGL